MSRPKSRRELYSEATRAALLETATAMFAERGYARTSLDDIAVATQVTRGAVYHHFESKQAVFEAVFDAQEKDVTQRVAAAAAGQPNAWEAGMTALDAFLDLCCEDRYGRDQLDQEQAVQRAGESAQRARHQEHLMRSVRFDRSA